MTCVDPGCIWSAYFRKPFELLLQDQQLGRLASKIVDLLVDPAEVNTRLVELTLKLLHLVGERSRVLLLKAIEEFELRSRTRSDFFDFVLAENVRAEYLI